MLFVLGFVCALTCVCVGLVCVLGVTCMCVQLVGVVKWSDR